VGRKAVSTALKLIKGNPGRRPLNAAEPVYPGLPPAPDWLKPTARAEWDRIMPGLAATGQIQRVDLAACAGYCAKFAEWCDLQQKAENTSPIILTGGKQHKDGSKGEGTWVQNPLRGLANTAFTLMLKAASELGITPTARTRIHGTQEQAADPFEQFLGAHAASK